MKKKPFLIRRLGQAIMLLSGALGLTNCVDAGTGPRAAVSTFGVVPEWKGGASRALAILDEGGFPLDRVRIILVRAPDATVKDTTVTMHRGDPALDLPLVVNVTPGETLVATLEFRSGTTILFTGTTSVVTVPLNRPNPTPAVIPMEYVGPGKTAARVSITPSAGTFETTGSITVAAAAFDATDALLPNTPFEWSASDATMGEFTSPGVFVPSGKAGPLTVTATTPTGISGSATFTLVTPSVVSGIAVVSGNGQSAAVNTALANPLVVRVTDGTGQPLSGITVSWARLTGSGQLSAVTSTTNASGLASAQYTFATVAGTETIRASVAGLTPTVTFTAHAVAGAPVAIAIVSGNSQIDTVMKQLPNPFVVKVSDSFGNGVAGTPVSWARAGGFGTPANATSTTDAAGLASLSYRLGDIGGADTVDASVSGVATPVRFIVGVRDGLGVPIVTGFAYLHVLPSPVTSRVGDTLQFAADSVSATGQTAPVTATWASSHPGRGTINATGRMIVGDTGAIIVTATRNGLVGHARVTVLAAPKLTSFSLSPTTLNGITNSALTTSVSFAAVDAGTGITSATVTLTSPTGTTQSCTVTAPTTGTARNGVFDCALTLPAGSPTGTWRITNLVLNGSITRTFGESVLALFGTTTLTVNP